MSGIKENQEIRQVQQVNSTPVKKVSIRISQNQLIPTVIETAASAALTLVAPQLIKAAFESIGKAAANLSIAEVQKIASNSTLKAVSTVSFSNVKSAQQVATMVSQIQSAKSVAEIKATCTKIETICIQEQMPVFKDAITTTVKTVMAEVGFTNIVVRTIGITPVVIAKNNQGQTIRTEVTEGNNSKIDLIRIQSAIPESECDALNKKINAAFQKYGLDYTRFTKVGKASTQNRTYNFSEEECIEQNNQTTNLKQ